MKLRAILACIVLLALDGPVMGQAEYRIRINTATDVRSEIGTQSAKLGTILSGTEIEVIGEVGRWLQINWQGRTGWIAGWLGHTRLSTNSSTAAASPVGIALQFDPYTLFPDCDDHEFRENANQLLDTFYTYLDLMVSVVKQNGIDVTSLALKNGGRIIITKSDQTEILACRRAVELNIIAQQLYTDFFILSPTISLADEEALDTLSRFIAIKGDRLLELTPFYQSHQIETIR